MFNNINVQIKRMFNRFSAYGRPINVCLSQGFQLSPQYFIFRKGTIRVLIDNGLGYFTDILQKLSVAGYIRYFQIESNAAPRPLILMMLVSGKYFSPSCL